MNTPVREQRKEVSLGPREICEGAGIQTQVEDSPCHSGLGLASRVGAVSREGTAVHPLCERPGVREVVGRGTFKAHCWQTNVTFALLPFATPTVSHCSSLDLGDPLPTPQPPYTPPVRPDQVAARTLHFIWPLRAGQSWVCSRQIPHRNMRPWKWKRVGVDMIPLLPSYFWGPGTLPRTEMLRVPPISVS